jgi:hypothetical protein
MPKKNNVKTGLHSAYTLLIDPLCRLECCNRFKNNLTDRLLDVTFFKDEARFHLFY